MKALLVLFLLTSTAHAQSLLLPPAMNVMPKTYPLTDMKTKQIIGTATVTGNRLYLRDLKKEHFATVEFHKDKKIIYDPSGNILERLPLPNPIEAIEVEP